MKKDTAIIMLSNLERRIKEMRNQLQNEIDIGSVGPALIEFAGCRNLLDGAAAVCGFSNVEIETAANNLKRRAAKANGPGPIA